MKNLQRLAAIIVILLAVVAGTISIYCVIKAVQWVNRPFAGFMVYHPAYVGSYSYRDWPGKLAGLKYLERIRAVGERPVQFGEDVGAALKDKAPGTEVQYSVESKGTVRNVTVAVDVFDLKDFFLVFSINFVVGLAICVLGFVVYFLKPNTTTSWVFLVLCFCVGNYGTTGFEIQSSYSLVRFHYTVLSIFPFTFLHLGLVFPERKRILVRFPSIAYLIYIPALLLIIGYQIYFSTFPDIVDILYPFRLPTYIDLSAAARVFTLLGFVGFLVLVLHSYLRSSSIMARQRAKMMIFGVAIAFLPVAILGLLAVTTGIYFPFNFVSVSAVFFPLLIAYSIVRHNLFDADVLIRRTVGYTLVTVIIIGAYAAVSLVLNVMLEQYRLAESEAFPILFTLVIIFVFNPLRDRLQGWVDRIFFRKDYNAGAIIDKIGSAITHLMEVPQILNMLVQTFMEDMFLETSSVMLLTPDGRQFKVMLADGNRKDQIERQALGRETPLIQTLEEKRRELTLYDLLEDPKYREISQSGKASFEDLDASLMVPLVYQDKVIGSFNLGEKKSGKPFNRDDIELLRQLANQGAIAIENARLFEENLEKQRMEEELNIARDLQLSMLPAECPELSGFQIAAVSTQAQEVGGDFYDFIQMEHERLGIVIGDVTGKSVSGALVMEASRSVFRLLSENVSDVGDIMGRANRRLIKDVKTGMFVALLYAVIDPDSKTLSMCSAGQTQPIYCNAVDGNAVLMETEGDNFPLGILGDANYEDTSVPLKIGDKVVFYTDGIVEAMNGQREVFGFDRLIEVVQTAYEKPAEGMLKAILESVEAHVGAAPQHDDLTVIVLGVK
jgi:sigma-B regulation protein RsbU (phosphoserine phosphatase)